MIRIHAGLHKGLQIKRVGIESTKETASMVREAVFNSLHTISGNVLDLFAGSGSYGITALSLGASFVTFVDVNNLAVKTINENILKTKTSAMTETLKSDYESFIKSTNNKYDLVFLDPPYNYENYLVLLNLVFSVMNPNSKIVLEIDKKTKVVETFNNFKILKEKKYGSKKIVIYSNY